MAEKRMFNKEMISSDIFTSMPISTQALYFHLCMNADDEGFVDRPKNIMKSIGASEDDIKILLGKRYILAFESGIIVIKHWYIHNWIRQDRIKPTKYQEELATLTKKENGAYTELSVKCQSSVSQVSDKCQASIEEYSIDKYSIDKNIKKVSKKEDEPTFNDIINNFIVDTKLNAEMKEWVKGRLARKEKLTNYAIELACKKVLKMPVEKQIPSVEESIINGWKSIYEINDTKLKQTNKNKETAQQRDDRNLKKMLEVGEEMLKEWNNDNRGNKQITKTD